MSSSATAFVFPGQGSQSPGMLVDLAERHPSVLESFAEASAGAGVDLWAIASAADDARLNQTEFTQPVLLAASVALFRLWRAQGGGLPARLAGHSLGEYSALVAADSLSLSDAAALVRERGRLMQAAVPAGTGAMAAVLGADDAVVEEVCAAVSAERVVVPANYNSPGQIVIGGHAEAVDAAIAALAERGVRKAVKLAVSVPSHTPLMREAADALAARIEATPLRLPSLPLVHNVDAGIAADLDALKSALVRQLYLPVRWTDCVQQMIAAGASRFVECGPGKVLGGLIKRIDRGVESKSLGSVADFEDALNGWGER
ncbi:ACP S-malonyltransferase [Aquimonas voraii]|uniref:Malonyl CoA-acyl carrier protein transacylase n=1 Tax=Aquimonas voraii TaxID=265719 RepID=A0A1G6RTU0_9GAMM|nr:ACP S-malonyltransferase [Aquimonas voraii]SDD07366.1 [Acyl-carrier-protein] S-malonyltransferase [Aquimonas voraii]